MGVPCTADPPSYRKDYYFWSDGITPGYGDYAYGRVPLSSVFEFWGGGQPDFWTGGGAAEQTAECQSNGGNDWNDLRGDNTNRYVICRQWCEWRTAATVHTVAWQLRPAWQS